MQLIGKAIKTYATEHEEQLPGPLSQDQYTLDAAGRPPRDGQLLKYIERHLEQPANAQGHANNAKTIFTTPAWENAEHATDAPVFLVNIEKVPAFSQPAWGQEGKPPLKLSQLKDWTWSVGMKEHPVEISKMWALTEADQKLAKLIGINPKIAQWVKRMRSAEARPLSPRPSPALYPDPLSVSRPEIQHPSLLPEKLRAARSNGQPARREALRKGAKAIADENALRGPAGLPRSWPDQTRSGYRRTRWTYDSPSGSPA